MPVLDRMAGLGFIDRGKMFTVYTLALLITLSFAKKEIPSYLHICKRSDPDVGNCIKSSVEFLRPQLAQGIPELNLPPIEPLYIKELMAIDGRGIKVVTTDLYIQGCSSFTIESIKADIDNGVFECKLQYPQLSITGKYVVNGSILMLPIKGEGDLTGEVLNSGAIVVMKSEFKVENGEKYLQWKGMEMDISIEKGKVHLTNLFGGEKLLGDVVNAAININFNHFFHELKPLIEKVLEDFLLESAQKITQGYDYNEIFPN